jgi:hypothetical protein
MGLFLARVTGPLVGLALAVFSFVFQAVLRRRAAKGRPVGRAAAYIAARAGGAGAVYFIVLSAVNFVRYTPGISSIILVSAPLLIYGAAILAHFELLAWGGLSGRGGPTGNYAAAVASALQSVLLIFSLVTRWRNFTTGMSVYLYLLLADIFIAGAGCVLFFVSARKTPGRKAQ